MQVIYVTYCDGVLMRVLSVTRRWTVVEFEQDFDIFNLISYNFAAFLEMNQFISFCSAKSRENKYNDISSSPHIYSCRTVDSKVGNHVLDVSLISRAEDALQPTPQQLDAATNEARTYWCSLAEEAITHLKHGLALESLCPQEILCKVPAIPDTQLATHEVVLAESPIKELWPGASSTIRVIETGTCDTGQTTKETQAGLLMGVQSPIACNFLSGGASFLSSRNPRSRDSKAPNYIAY